MERLMNMILRRVVNKGMNAGVRAVARRGETSDGPQSHEEKRMAREQEQNAKSTVRNVRNASRLMRRMGKF